MLRHGFSVAQVVQGYGDVCQAITELAMDLNARISTEDFRTLNRSLDVATADAVSEFEHQRDRLTLTRETERLGVLAHELRNQLNSATLAFEMLKRGNIGVAGSTGAVLGRSLSGLRATIDKALAEVRLESGLSARERMRVSEFIDEMEAVATFEASEKGLTLVVRRDDGGAEVHVDRLTLASALGNLLQNALKFTQHKGNITLTTHATKDRVFIDIEDECGGLPKGGAEALFKPYEQRSSDRTGLGLGLAISRRAVEANDGEIHVRDLPRKGCVFTVDLPRAIAPQ
jgi:signal transduction histidine kinase